MSTATQLIHSFGKTRNTSDISVPVYQALKVNQNNANGTDRMYRTRGNLPIAKLNHIVTRLDDGIVGIAFGSGVSTLHSLVSLLNSGNEVIAVDVSKVSGDYFEKYGIKVKYIQSSSVQNIFNLTTKETRLIWIETPASS